MKMCRTCRYWEAGEGGEDLGDHERGDCCWLDGQIAPMWLSHPDVLLRPQALAGAGRDCEAWGELKDETERTGCSAKPKRRGIDRGNASERRLLSERKPGSPTGIVRILYRLRPHCPF